MKRDLKSALGTMIYPRSHLCKSVKYGKIGCQLPFSHQVGIVDSQADHNEKDNKSKALTRYRKKLFGKTTEDIKRI
jgi:hypothetical protein